MVNEIEKLNAMVFKPLSLNLTNVTQDLECEAYFGFNFKVDDVKIKFRKSKLTPKKTGQFVTYWKRDPDGKTVPFDVSDDFNFYITAIVENNNSGFFIFPKAVLEKENLILGEVKVGKRGFRLYADWHLTDSTQAEKTKLWQSQYFINYSDRKNTILEKFAKLIQK